MTSPATPTFDSTTGSPPPRRRWIPISLRVLVATLLVSAGIAFSMHLPAYEHRVAFDEISRLVLSILAVAFVAVCVWVVVRTVNRRDRWGRRTAIGLAVVIAYTLLWGPACWIWHGTSAPDWLKMSLDVIYYPMDWLHWSSTDDSGNGPLHWYWGWWSNH